MPFHISLYKSNPTQAIDSSVPDEQVALTIDRDNIIFSFRPSKNSPAVTAEDARAKFLSVFNSAFSIKVNHLPNDVKLKIASNRDELLPILKDHLGEVDHGVAYVHCKLTKSVDYDLAMKVLTVIPRQDWLLFISEECYTQMFLALQKYFKAIGYERIAAGHVEEKEEQIAARESHVKSLKSGSVVSHHENQTTLIAISTAGKIPCISAVSSSANQPTFMPPSFVSQVKSGESRNSETIPTQAVVPESRENQITQSAWDAFRTSDVIAKNQAWSTIATLQLESLSETDRSCFTEAANYICKQGAGFNGYDETTVRSYFASANDAALKTMLNRNARRFATEVLDAKIKFERHQQSPLSTASIVFALTAAAPLTIDDIIAINTKELLVDLDSAIELYEKINQDQNSEEKTARISKLQTIKQDINESLSNTPRNNQIIDKIKNLLLQEMKYVASKIANFQQELDAINIENSVALSKDQLENQLKIHVKKYVEIEEDYLQILEYFQIAPYQKKDQSELGRLYQGKKSIDDARFTLYATLSQLIKSARIQEDYDNLVNSAESALSQFQLMLQAKGTSFIKDYLESNDESASVKEFYYLADQARRINHFSFHWRCFIQEGNLTFEKGHEAVKKQVQKMTVDFFNAAANALKKYKKRVINGSIFADDEPERSKKQVRLDDINPPEVNQPSTRSPQL
jgi:hypothetical protein